MPTPIEATLQIVFGPESQLRNKDPYIYDFTDQNLCWLHNCGSASKSVLQWLNRDYGKQSKLSQDKVKENQKPEKKIKKLKVQLNLSLILGFLLN